MDKRADQLLGKDCRHCGRGKPIEQISSPAGNVSLCLEGVLTWFPGKDVTWWKERHAVYDDHPTRAIKAGRKREFDRLMFADPKARKALGYRG